MRIDGPAIGVLELDSIARGMIVADAVVKRAQVSLHLAEAVSPGKYLLLFSGGVAEVEESFRAGEDRAGASLLDKLFLPQAAPALLDALHAPPDGAWADSVGVVETHTVAATLLAADVALKQAEVRLIQLRLARGIGGKGYFVLTGSLDMVQAALDVAAAALSPEFLQTVELIEQPHPELRGRVL
jgi:microcompartment protein CcmL/EutN